MTSLTADLPIQGVRLVANHRFEKFHVAQAVDAQIPIVLRRKPLWMRRPKVFDEVG
jgi:hypothetical protein